MSAKVLIVEPSRAFARLLGSFCEGHGAEAEIRSDIASALAFAQEGAPLAAITVSYQLEDGDGIALIYGLRAIGHLATTPILFLSSDDNPEMARTALVAGATEVFLKSESEAIEQALKSAVSEKTTLKGLTGRTLIVEDTEAIAKMLSRICETLGFEVDTATSAEEGFRIFQTRSYQLVVIDVILAGRDSGIDLVRNIRRLPDNRARLPILVTSSYNDTARRIELLRSGADDFIGKPLIEEEIIWRIQNLLQRTRWEPADAPGRPTTMDEVQLMLRQHYRLSSRESEIAAAIVRGGSDKAIASELGISFWTVRTHINHIFSKTGTFNRANLVSRVNTLRDTSHIRSPAPPVA